MLELLSTRNVAYASLLLTHAQDYLYIQNLILCCAICGCTLLFRVLLLFLHYAEQDLQSRLPLNTPYSKMQGLFLIPAVGLRDG
jgi:hypothetical protein